MKRIILFIYVSISIALPILAKQFIVIDEADKSPIVGATVIDKTGIIKGLTDKEGRININASELPITIHCVGYEPTVTFELNDTIQMDATSYQLNEVVVTPIGRPIRRIICFAREYSSGITGTDTMQYYCEYMTESFLVDGKVKGYRGIDSKPTPRSHKRYARISRNGVDSIFTPKRGDDITDLSWFDIMAFLPDKKVEVPAAILNGAESDTLPGKYGPQFIFRKHNNQFTKTADVLSNHKDRRWSPFIFKLLGMTMDITSGSWTLSFTDNGTNSFGINEFICGVYNIHLIGKGKWIKKIFETKDPIEMDTYLEIYPIEITNLTVDEYKEIRDDNTSIPFRYPDNIHPISPAIDEFVKLIEGK